MLQAFGVADAVFLFLQILDRAGDQRAVAGVHGDDAVLNALQEFKRVFPGQDRVAGVVVDAEVGHLDPLDEVAEDIHLLGELGVGPVVVLVVVLDDQRHAVLSGEWGAGLDALGRVLDAVRAADLGTPLAGEDPAVRPAEGCGHLDPEFLLVDLLLAELGIGVREVGRGTHHGDRHPVVFGGLASFGPAIAVLKIKQPGIELQPVDIERSGQVDPLAKSHRAMDDQIIHVGFGERSKFRHGGRTVQGSE